MVALEEVEGSLLQKPSQVLLPSSHNDTSSGISTNMMLL
jgi:hypothetical protein